MKVLTISLLFLLGLSCSDKGITPKVNDPFVIDYQKATLLDTGLKVEFSAIQESRCPEGVQCVREGELFATLIFEFGNSKTEAEFCISGECLSREGEAPDSIYYSGNEVVVGSEKYQLIIEDFTPKIPSQSNPYSLTLKVIK